MRPVLAALAVALLVGASACSNGGPKHPGNTPDWSCHFDCMWAGMHHAGKVVVCATTLDKATAKCKAQIGQACEAMATCHYDNTPQTCTILPAASLQYVTEIGATACYLAPGATDPIAGFEAQGMPFAPVDAQASSVTISINGTASTVNPTSGGMAFLYDAATGQLRIGFVDLAIPDFSVGSHKVSGGEVWSVGTPTTTVSASGHFKYGPGSLAAFGQATVDGHGESDQVALAGALAGQLDMQARELTLRGVFKEGGVSIDLGPLALQLTDLPPHADAGAATQYEECNDDLAATFTLDGSGSSDPNGDTLNYDWYEVGTSSLVQIATGVNPTVTLPLGKHQVELVVTDPDGLSDASSIEVVVRDTKPPVLSNLTNAGPACLWPPNHKYVVLRVGRDFTAMITDACDPNPVMTITGVDSNQPANGTGDGNTSPDAVAFPDHVCLRAERQGGSQAGRIYTVHFAAHDHEGNSSDPSLEVQVAHDQRGHACPALKEVELATNADPVCSPSSPDALSSSAHRRVSAGCGASVASGGESWPAFALLLLLLWGVRALGIRRRARVDEGSEKA